VTDVCDSQNTPGCGYAAMVGQYSVVLSRWDTISTFSPPQFLPVIVK